MNFETFEDEKYLEETKDYLDEHRDVYEKAEKIVSVEELRDLVKPFPELVELLEESLLPNCIRYVHTIAEFEIHVKLHNDGEMDSEEFEKRGESRSRIHDAMIGQTNALLRNLRKNGVEIEWDDGLNSANRVKYAILAICLTVELLVKRDIV